MNGAAPAISVVIPLYNHESYIEQAINSVLTQSVTDLEVIVIDDGSVDKSANVIRSFSDKRLSYLYQTNQGAHNALNRGIGLAKGKYISILNSDDVYSPRRLEKCLSFLESNSDYSAVITQVEGITGTGAPVADRKTPAIKAWLDWYAEALGLFRTGDFYINCFAKNILITTSNYFFKKEVFDDVGGFRSLRYAHDWDMLLRMAQYHKVWLMRENLLQYRFHDSNTVHEADSEVKVRYEVNWLIAENLRTMKRECDVLELIKAVKMNHYVTIETLFPFLLGCRDSEDFPGLGPASSRLFEYIKQRL